MCKHSFLICITLTAIFSLSASAKTYDLHSPDGDISVTVTVDEQVWYSVSFKGQTILAPSALSMTTSEGSLPGDNPVVKEVRKNGINETLRPVVREKYKEIQNHYEEITLVFGKKTSSLTFRAYDDGVAYRFATALDNPARVISEQIEYNFPADYNIYFPQEDSFYTHQERMYQYSRLSKLEKGKFCSIPALVDVPNGPKIALTESDLIDYPGFYLQAQGNTSLKAVFPQYPKKEEGRSDRDRVVTETEDYIAKTGGTRAFPWRAMIIAGTDGDLILSQMVYKLASPCELKDTSWIRPGKVAWDWWNDFNTYGVDFRSGVNTDNYKYYIDFASKYGIEYIILDEGWYQHGDLLKTVDAVDMEELLAYGKQKTSVSFSGPRGKRWMSNLTRPWSNLKNGALPV